MLRLPFLNKKFPKFKAKKWDKILNFSKFETLNEQSLIDDQIRYFLDLIEKTLVYDPNGRISMQEVMTHPFLTTL
jgi:serine/threonine protein kinase